jgi:CubicO group peptidase (beta-lactamase class C family)
MKDIEKKFQEILDRAVNNKKIFGTSFCLKYQGEYWCAASGNLQTDSQYFIASTTKLFITTIILNFRSKGILNLDDKIAQYLPASIVNGLNVFHGKDYSDQITIKQLLAHTSGIPDYFQGRVKGSKSWEIELKSGSDRSWTSSEAVEHSKRMKPAFIPGISGKAQYSDTNFQLLGAIIETLTQRSINEDVNNIIIEPAGLDQTYLYTDAGDLTPASLYYKGSKLEIPKAMVSFGPDGGVVSTSRDMMVFIENFFSGKFFPASYIDELKVWNRIFYPMQSGIGIHLFKLPAFLSPFQRFPELIGHSGLSGALAYYCPEKEFFVTGTVNQIAYPDSSFRLALKLIQMVTK